MRRVFSILIVLSLLAVLFTACAGSSESKPADTGSQPANEVEKKTGTEEQKTAAEEKIVIGFTHCNLSNEFMVTLQNGLEDRAKELGVELLCTNPEMDPEKQMQQVESFIAQKVDAIIMDPVDADASSPAVKKIQEAGIPIVNVNSVTEAEPDAFIGSNDEEAAEIAINYIADRLNGKGKIAMIHGNPGQSAEIKRSDGAYRELKKYPDIELVAEQEATWSREKAMALTENWIQAFPDLDAIFSQNDEMAMGALKALEDNGIKQDVVLIGVDAIPDALQAIKDGRLDATVFQDAYSQGSGSVDLALKIIKGEDYDKEVFIPFKLVTKENVDDFLK
ncbi:MAG: substrate-binding domain-containing protein [Acetivibrionales bacterium]|jgi:inositol transport system substrate-binding protein